MNESTNGTATADTETMTANRNLVHRYFTELWNGANESLSDTIITQDYVGHTLIHGSADHVGIEGHRKWVRSLRTAFPDLSIAIEDIIAEGDKVVARVLMTGTHRGTFGAFAPTDRHAVSPNIFIVRIEDGRIAEGWISFDAASFWKQLGIG